MSSSLPVMKIKTVFKKDIRRLDLSEVSFHELSLAVAAAYNIPSRSFELAFKDDEGDVCKISGDAELAEALTVAASLSAKALKVYVTEKGSAIDASDDVEVEAVPFGADIDAKTDDAPEAAPPAAPASPSSEAKTTETPAPSGEAPKKPSCEELRALVLEFLRDKPVQGALLPFANTVLTLLEGNEDVETLIEIALASHEDVGSHALIQRLRPFLPIVLPALTEKVAVLRTQPHIIQMARGFLPLVLPLLLQHPLVVNGDRPAADASEAPDFSSFVGGLPLPPPLIAALSGIAAQCQDGDGGDYDDAAPFEVEVDVKAAPGAPAAAPTATPAAAGAPAPNGAHRNIICDGCGVHPIVGDRYKCTVCDDYDLCSTCEAKNVHPVSHPLIKMKVPFGSEEHLKTVQHSGVACDGCGVHPIVGARYKCSVCHDYDLCETCEGKGVHDPAHPLVKMKLPKSRHGPIGPGAGHHGAPWRRGGHCGGRGGRGGPMRHLAKVIFGGRRGPCGRRAPGGPGGPGGRGHCHRRAPQVREPNAAFVKDGNLSDRTVVGAGESLIKVWIMKNNGEKAWPEGTKLIFVRGDRELSAEEEFPVPAAEPGQEVEVSAVLSPPSKAKQTRYCAYFRLADAERSMFGPKVWVDLIVKPSADAPPTPAAAAEDNSGTPVDDEKAKQASAPPAAAAAPEKPAIDPELVSKYAMQLQILTSMGFHDEVSVLNLLDKHKGDVQATYKELVSLLV